MIERERLARLRRRARQYLDAGQPVLASAALEAVLALAPDDDEARLDLAAVRLALGHYRQAHALACAASHHAPGDPRLALTRLHALRALAEHERMQRIAGAVVVQELEVEELVDGASALEAVGLSDQARRWIAAARARPTILARVSIRR